jgi:nitrate reductase gamma subunit
MDNLNEFLFGIYPYVCLTVFFIGSLVRFDREQYTWKSDSSQLLRARELRWGSNLFHIGVLLVFLGHLFGFLTPEWAISWLLSPSAHQLLAMVTGGLAGLLALIGLTLLLHRRLADARIRSNSRPWDIAIVLILWVQLGLGLATIPLSAQHMDGAAFLRLVQYVQGVVSFHGGNASLLIGVPLVYRLHLVLGLTIFLVFPFTRLVHIWSGFAAIAYAFRPYQLVRTRRKWVRG